MKKNWLLIRMLKYIARKKRERIQQALFSSQEYLQPISKSVADIAEANPTDTIFVIGNGPSLNHQNLDLLAGKFTIASNAFYLIYDRIDWRPTIFTIEDHLIVDDNKEFFNQDKESWKFIPYDMREKIRNGDKAVYINFLRSYLHWSRKDWPFFSGDVTAQSYWGGTVSFLSLQIAATFKPKRIILLGTDLSYKIPDSVKRDGINLLSTKDDVNHFSPDYFGAGKKWHIPEVHRMQQSFDSAYMQLAKLGIDLLNATHGGNLKNIPRISYDELFS